jgi:SAM-dependent methyltransferase
VFRNTHTQHARVEATSRRSGPAQALDACVAAFLVGVAVPEAELRRRLGARAVVILLETRFLHRVDDERVAAAAQLFPVRGRLVATDWSSESLLDEADAVMAVGAESLELALLYDAPGDAVLDACCGSGVQALCRGAAAATLVDVSARALRFARLNAALNGVEGCAFELRDAAAGLPAGPFDVVVANPPFVAGGAATFAGGGDDGNAVLAPLVARIAGALADTGVALVASEFADVRGWCDARAPDALDALLFYDAAHVEDAAAYAAGRCEQPADADALAARMTRAGAATMCSGLLLLRTRLGDGPPLRRVVELPSAGSPDVGYLERPAVCARIRSDAAQFHGRYGAFA